MPDDLSEREEIELLAHLEAELAGRASQSLRDYVRYVPIPGVPINEGDPDCEEFYPDVVVPAVHHLLMLNQLERVILGEIRRLMFFLPPGSAKSSYGSVVFPPALMGRVPGTSIIATSYGDDLAKKFGRKCRSIVRGAEYQRVYGTSLVSDNKAVDDWAIENGSQYMCSGILGAITGNRANVLLVDDPVRGREDADSLTIRDKIWEAYKSDLRTRLKPNGSIVIIQCMVGSTRVLLADGAEKPLRDIRAGDVVATHKDGRLSSAKVLNWASQGSDRVFTIKTTSGINVTANGRHPFLVKSGEKTEWRRLRDLRNGDRVLRVIGGNGAGSHVPSRDATSRQSAEGSARRTTTRLGGRAGCGPLQSIGPLAAMPISGIVMGLEPQTTTRCSPLKTGDAPFADCRQRPMYGRTGAENSASIIVTTVAKSGDCSATTAISQSGTEKLKPCSPLPLDTYEIIPDVIVEITEAGEEEVFDIQVEGTENFIANGLVSHNTRWHEDDLAGRILPLDYDGRSGWVTARDGEQWFVVNLPAQCEREDDPINRKIGEYLWTDWFSEKFWEQEKISQGPRNWSALYQQRPTPETGTYFQKEWLRYYTAIPAFLKIYMAADYAVTAKGGDYTVIGVFGIDPQENIYVLDWWRGQVSSAEWVEAVCDFILKYQPIELIEEKGQIEKGVGPFLAKRQQERNAFCAHKLYASSADKATRAQAIRGRMYQGKVYLPDPGLASEIHKENTCNWVEPLIYEVVRFRGVGDEVDDQVDTLSLIGRRLNELATPTVPVTEEERQRQRVERMARVARERPTWDGVVQDVDRRDGRQRGRIS